MKKKYFLQFQTVLLFVFLVFSLTAGSCNSDSAAEAGRNENAPPTVCDGDADCPGQHCDTETGSCVDCVIDDHCGAQQCVGNVCVDPAGGQAAPTNPG